MASSKESWQEWTMKVPREMMENSSGIAFDIGGSSCKFVYRAKEDVEALAEDTTSLGRLRLVLADKKAGLAPVVEHLKEHADLGAGKKVFCTGGAAVLAARELKEQLGLELELTVEFDAACRVFVYLLTSDLPLEEWLDAPHHDTEREAMADYCRIVANARQLSPDSARPEQLVAEYFAPMSAELPIALTLLGSGNGYFKVDSDYEMTLLDGSFLGGKMFVGAGRLLTGAQDYHELLALASAGDASRLDQWILDCLPAPEAGDDFYHKFREDPNVRAFRFGKADTAKDVSTFAAADQARALLETVVTYGVKTSVLNCRAEGCHNVLVYGSFASSDLVKDALAREYAREAMTAKFVNKRPVVRPYFTKFSPFMGALGAWLTELVPRPKGDYSGWFGC